MFVKWNTGFTNIARTHQFKEVMSTFIPDRTVTVVVNFSTSLNVKFVFLNFCSSVSLEIEFMTLQYNQKSKRLNNNFQNKAFKI